MDDDLSSSFHHSPQWITHNGGWIHSNNVLFYFAESPFFDRTSTNQSLITQSQGIPEREYENLSTRKRFESKLALLPGLQYVVAHDPLEYNTKFRGPDGEEQSDIWVIKRQIRHRIDGRDDDVTVTGYYFILNQAIFQAPSMASILSYRFLNTTLAMESIFSTASSLPVFSVSHGHTYHKPAQRHTQAVAGSTAASRDPTPMPDEAKAQDKLKGTQTQLPAASTSTLRDALSLSMRYGKEYIDEMPLVGEPGNFRFARTKDATQASELKPTVTPQAVLIQASTPAPAAATTTKPATSPPKIQTDVLAVTSRKSSAKSPSADNPMKPKRRKSKAATQTP